MAPSQAASGARWKSGGGDLVCVATAGHYADAMQGWLPLLLLNRDVLPAVA